MRCWKVAYCAPSLAEGASPATTGKRAGEGKRRRLRRRIETLGTASPKLSAAVLRISASLDLETVLRETDDGTRELTGARFGLITTVDDAAQPQDFVTAGLTADEHTGMAA